MLKEDPSTAPVSGIIKCASSANEVWLDLLRQIVQHGKRSKPRGLEIQELLCQHTVVDMVKPVVSVQDRRMGYAFMAAEAWWILSGRNDVESIKKYSPHIAAYSNDGIRFDGAYGPKIIDQLRYVCDSLEKDMDSRQAVLEIWRPNPRDSRDVACTLTIQWLVRDGKLHCIDTMRSSDAWLGWVYDTFNFSMLSALVLLTLRQRDKFFNHVGMGTLHLVAGSSHLYVDPKRDGSTSIPYDLHRVDSVLTGPRTVQSYTPFDVDQFTGPEHLVTFLGDAKDRAIGKDQWLGEFLGRSQ